MPGANADPLQSVCAIVVTFNPGESLYENVQALLGQVSSVLQVDNGSSARCRSLLDRVAALPRTQVIRNTVNVGVGAALNLGVRWAISHGYPWVATFDQDSRAEPGFVTEMLQTYANFPGRETIGLVAPRYREQTSGFIHDDPFSSPTTEIAVTSMMSGNLVRTDVIAEVGFYNESFFIDYVDNEFCLRLARNGYQVLRSFRSVLQHNLGQMSYTKFGGRVLATTNHSPLRRYYNARNRILVYRQYWRLAPGWVARDLKSFFVETAKIALLEQQRRAKLVNVARGVCHGLFKAKEYLRPPAGTTVPTP